MAKFLTPTSKITIEVKTNASDAQRLENALKLLIKNSKIEDLEKAAKIFDNPIKRPIILAKLREE